MPYDDDDWSEKAVKRRKKERFLRDNPDPRKRREIAMRIAANENPAPPLKVRSLADLMNEPDEDVCWLLRPLLPEGGMMLLYGRRGAGKTWLGLELAFAAAAGRPVFDWPVSEPAKVLYVEGDMQKKHFTRRMKALARARGMTDEDMRRFDYCIATDQDEPMEKLDTIAGQYALWDRLRGVRLLILDSLSSLTDSSEHGGDGAYFLRRWLLMLRSSCAIVVVHHAGRRPTPRGPSRAEDPYDAIVGLHQPHDWRARDGWRATLKVEKARHSAGDGLQSLDMRMTMVDGAPTWAWSTADETALDTFVRLWTAGKTMEEIAERTAWSRATRYRLRAEALERGLIDKRPEAA